MVEISGPKVSSCVADAGAERKLVVGRLEKLVLGNAVCAATGVVGGSEIELCSANAKAETAEHSSKVDVCC